MIRQGLVQSVQAIILLGAPVLAGTGAPAQGDDPPTFEVIEINPPDGMDGFFLSDMNDAGEVCGFYGPTTSGPLRPFLWREGTILIFPALPSPGDWMVESVAKFTLHDDLELYAEVAQLIASDAAGATSSVFPSPSMATRR